MKVNHLNTAAALLLAGFAMNAVAAPPEGELNVTGNITASCTFTDTPQPLDFLNIDLNVGGTATAILNANCHTDGAAVFATAAGNNDGVVGGYTYAMNDGTSGYIGYNMSSATAAGNWDPIVPLSFTPSLNLVAFDFNGQINADQSSYVGGVTLFDTVIVSVTF